MNAVLFKADCDDAEWFGVAFARNKMELFWQIDQHTDPYSCLIRKVRSGSVAMKLSAGIATVANAHDDVDFSIVDTELSEEVEDAIYESKWHKPVWPENPCSVFKGDKA